MVKIGKILKKKGFDNEIIISLNIKKANNVSTQTIPFLFLELLPGSKVPYRVKKIKYLKNNQFQVLFDRVDEESQIQQLLQKDIYLPQKGNEQLVSQEAFLEVILGFELWDQSEKIGKIDDFYDIEPHRLLVVYENKQELLVPFVEDWIIAIEAEKRKLIMKLPTGLFDLDE